MDSRTPQVVDQFEYPRLPTDWRGGNPATVVDVAAGNGRMTPWTVESPVQLVRGTAPGQGGMGLQGYHLGLGGSGSLERVLTGLDPGRDYRLSLRYARDGRSAGTDAATTALSVGDLSTTLTAGPGLSSQNAFGTYVGSFTAAAAPADAEPVRHRHRRHDDRRPGRGGGGPGSLRRPGPLRVRGGLGRHRRQHRRRLVGRGRRPDGHHRLVAERRARQGDRPAGRLQRQRRGPAGQPPPGRGRLHHLVLGASRHEEQLDRAVPPRRRARRRRQLLPDPDADPGPGQHRAGRHLQGEGQRPPGARLRRADPGRGRQPVEPRGLHPPGHDRHALPQRRTDRDARQPDDHDGRRRPDGEQLAGSQRLPRPGVRRADGRRPRSTPRR